MCDIHYHFDNRKGNKKRFDEYFKFCTVRNPWKRMFSLYKFYNRKREWTKESFRKFVKQQIAIREAILSQGNKGVLQQEFLDPDDPVAIYSERDGMKFPLTSEYNEKIGKLNKPKILNFEDIIAINFLALS